MRTLTIADQNFLPQYQTNSAHITETAQSKPNVMDMLITSKPGQTVPQQGAELVFKDGSRFLFGGFISKVEPQEIGVGQMFISKVEVSDYSYIFNSKIARRAYENQTLEHIVEDLLDTYVDASYGFDTTNVATGPTIASITFDHISIRKCFEKLQELTGYLLYVDYEKKVFAHAPTAVAAPETFTDETPNHEFLSIAYDTSQCANAVIVIGHSDGEQSAATEVETFEGDGETRSWELQDKPSEVVSITLNDASQQFSLDVNERDTDVFIYSFSGSSFRLTDSQTTPAGDPTPDEIEITYYPRVPVIAREIDPESITFFAALDGGDGILEQTIKDQTVTTKEEATARALQILAERAMPLVNGTIHTRTSLLDGSIFKPGQYLTINSPANGIDEDTAFLIQEVDIELTEDGDTTEYVYTIQFGGKVVGIREFLESIAAREGDVTNADVVITIEQTTDAMELADDTPTMDLFTPPFEWGIRR